MLVMFSWRKTERQKCKSCIYCIYLLNLHCLHKSFIVIDQVSAATIKPVNRYEVRLPLSKNTSDTRKKKRPHDSNSCKTAANPDKQPDTGKCNTFPSCSCSYQAHVGKDSLVCAQSKMTLHLNSHSNQRWI